jgi:hypothetical protein
VSTNRVLGLALVVALVVMGGALLWRLWRGELRVPSAQDADYEEWLTATARPVLIHKVSPALVRLMDCVEAKDPDCICNPSIMPDRSEFLAEIKARQRQVPAGLASLHSALDDAVTKYQRLRQSVQSFCGRGASLSGIPSLANELERCTKARDKAAAKLEAYER